MATWTDGAAYAPLERPDGFATPEVEPLTQAEPFQSGTVGSIPRPRNLVAPEAVPLEQVQVTPPPSRPATQPFAVSSASMTAGSTLTAPGAPRDPHEAFQVRSTSLSGPDLPPPTGEPLPPPRGSQLPAPDGAPLAATNGSALPVPPGAPAGSPMLPPGTFPPPSAAELEQAEAIKRTLVMLALVCSVMGIILQPAAGLLVAVSGLLVMRTASITGKLGPWALGTGLALGLITYASTDPAVYNLAGMVLAVVTSVALLFCLVRPVGNGR